MSNLRSFMYSSQFKWKYQNVYTANPIKSYVMWLYPPPRPSQKRPKTFFNN